MFGLDFMMWTLSEAIEELSEISRNKECRLVFTPNVDHLVLIDENEDFLKLYQSADFLLADGMPIVWFSRLIGRPLPERVTGADLLPGLCERAPDKGLSVYLLGGAPDVTPEAKRRLMLRFPELKIVGIDTPPIGFEKDEKIDFQVVKAINNASPNILFVAFGAPKQELWAERHRKDLNVGLILGVGGTFDFVAGAVSRAPLWIRSAGFEWLWRLACEPRRLWKRYLKDLKFLGIAIREWKNQKR